MSVEMSNARIKPKKKNRLTTKQPILFYILGLY